MSIPGAASPLFLATTGAADAFEISRSLRFNSGDSSYLNRTPSSAGNRKTWTWSGWVKRSALGSATTLFSADVTASSDYLVIRFESDTIRVDCQGDGQGRVQVTTSAVYRDPSAWYHIVVVLDTTQSTAADRCKIYVNSALQTTSNTLSQNKNFAINATVGHEIGRRTDGNDHYFDGYLAEINFVDGSALDPSSFGETDSDGVWRPIDTAGLTFGTNGFRLKFADNSSAAALGTDSSGNSNTWTVNNLTATTPASYPSGSAQIVNGSPSEGTAINNLWNGAYSSYPGDFLTGADGRVLKINWSSGISNVTSIRYYSKNGNDRHNINSGGWSSNSGSGQGWKTAYSGSAITLTQLELQKADGVSYVKIGAIEINGKVVPSIGSSADIDSLVDSPTNAADPTDSGVGNEVVGNYATLNPLKKDSNTTLSQGNLKAVGASSTAYSTNTQSTFALSTGKWYYETTLVSTSSTLEYVGWTRTSLATTGNATVGNGLVYRPTNGNYFNLSGTNIGSIPTTGAGGVIQVAIDFDAGNIWFGSNGTWFGSGNPGTGANPAMTFTGGSEELSVSLRALAATFEFNFGQRAFAYTAPSGYKALNTSSLPTPTIADGSQYFDTKLWTGTGSARSITGFKFGPDLFWSKSRSTTWNNGIHDIVRGPNKLLRVDTTGAEYTAASPNESITSFNADGVTFGADGAAATVNYSGTYVGWAWDAGTSTVTNNDGSIASQVRAQPSAGFSVVTYSAGSTGATVGHGLNAAPGLIIVKGRTNTVGWVSYHSSLGKDKYIYLNYTNAAATSSNYWGSSTPNSTVFGLSNNGYDNNLGDMVAYCFAPVAGYSAMGSYVGNGSTTNPPFVYLGFKPAFLIIRKTNGGAHWIINDSTRNPSNVADNILRANESGAEYVSTSVCADFLSNGFKLRSGVIDQDTNGSGGEYIYIAFASNPFASNGGLAR